MKKLIYSNYTPLHFGVRLLVCILLLLSNKDIFAQSICFSSHNDFVYQGTSNANALDYGDFDNDGVLDIVEANFTAGANKMVFIKGNSNGTFQPPVIFDAGTRPYDVKAYDFNLDGNLDLVVVNNTGATISIAFGNGDGTFLPVVTYATGTGPSKVALGDLNEDGFIDLAVTCLSTGYVNLYLMDSGAPGVFIPSGTVVTGAGPRGITINDFNNDGHLDIATANSSAAGFGVVLGTGTGTFGAATSFTTQAGCFGIISGDFNGDGLPDIAASNETSNSISVAINTGIGFTASVNYTVKSLPNGIKIGDFNNDGFVDLVAVEYGDNVFTILQGLGTGAFLPATHFTCIGSPRDLVIYDCNGDGNLDAILSTQVGQVLPVFLGLGNGSFQHRPSYPVGSNPQGISKGDVNNDGFQDIVVANTGSNTVEILLNNGSGEFVSGGTFTTDIGPMSVETKDINGDGNIDIVTANNTNNTITVLLGNGSGGFTSAGNFNCNAQPKIVKIGDVNDDGFLDAVVLNATNTFNVLLGNGTGSFGAPTAYPGANNGTDLELGLLNADFYLDVVMTAGGNHKLVVSLNSGSGTFNPMVEFDQPNLHTNPKGLALGDVNNDGNLDAVVAYNGSNNFARYLGNGSGGFSPVLASFTGGDTGPMDVELADLNNDGNLDVIAICEVSTSSTGYAPVFTGNGSVFTFFKRFSTDMGPARLVVADWNNDGLKDAGVVNSVSKTVSILKNSTAFIAVDGPLTFCEGAGTTFTATAATSHLWSSGETTQVIAPATSGSYTVQTTTGVSNWCSSTSTPVIADVSPSPTLTLSSDVSMCSGQTVTLTVSGADTYLWAGGLGTNNSITVSPASTQYFVVEGFGVNGCARKDSIQVTVISAPDASFTTLNSSYCQGDAAVTLVPGTTGGNFTGGGVTASVFDPSLAPIGTNTITYTIDLGGGCASTSSQTISVNTSPSATFSGLATTYCAADLDATLVPLQAGGTFSGTGISANQFSPTTAGVGTFLINYSITSGGCSNSSSISTTVNPMPNASFTGLAANYCVSDAIVTLTPAVSGGTFSGSGISGATFSPSSASLGMNTISYSITNGYGCISQTSAVTNVANEPDATFSGLGASYCIDNTSSLALTPVIGGGTFSGPGISGSSFNPSTANLGTNTITYSIAFGSCSASSSIQTIVYALPNANFSGLNGTYCASDAASVLVPSTGGGTFSGTGITGNNFDPSFATMGSNTITYSITSANGCSNTHSLTTNVVAGPSPNFSGLAIDYCESDASIVLTPTAGGGTFSGNGVVGSSFDPSLASLGTNTVSYQITGSGCTNTFSMQTTVHATPSASFSGLSASYCSADAGNTLVPLQLGGVFSGTGINGSTFDPSVADVGSNVVTYSITDAFGCSNVASLSTTVNESPDASFTGLNVDYCITQVLPVNLVPSISGGVFTGNGIIGSTFIPANANLGLNSINYEVTLGSCISNFSLQTTVHLIPNTNFSGLSSTYCSADNVSNLVPEQVGGTFSGSGIVGTSFDPSLAIIGNNVISYTISSGLGCSNTTSFTAVVTESLDASFTGLATDYCISVSTPVSLVPASLGGSFTGNGVSGNEFIPSNAPLGVNTISYQIINSGCVSNSSVIVVVNDVPNANYTGLSAEYCSVNQDYTLVPSTSGGMFSGAGVTGNTFNPYFAGAGNFTINYTVVNGSGCSNVSTQNISVYASPNANFAGLDANYCINDVPVVLIPTEFGGVFSGSGVVGNQFSPSIAGNGLFNVTYDISNANCSSSQTIATTVHDLPVVTFTGLAATYCSGNAGNTLVPNPAGGVFSGAGMVGNQFTPSGLLGNYTIEYEFTDAFGCSNSVTHSTSVFNTTDPYFTGVEAIHCSSDAVVTLVPTTAGGVFTGNGVVGSTFNPSLAPTGVNNIQYQVGVGACIGTYQFSTVVLAAPSVAVHTNANSLSVDLAFGITYQWVNCANMQPIVGATNFNFIPPFEGVFAVIASNANCTDTSECSNFFLNLKDVSVIAMNYYPNPTNGHLTIDLEENASIQLIDMSGRIISKEQLTKGKNALEIGNVSRGMYQLFITTESGLFGTYPLVKN